MNQASDGISVVISTLNRPDTLGRCLVAIWNARRRPLEIVVVDQSCGDATAAVVRKAKAEGFAIRYVRQLPSGLGASQNEGFRLARHEIVAVTDDDCIVDDGWLAAITEAFGSRPGLGALGGRVLSLPADGARTWPVSTRTSPLGRDFYGRGFPWAVGSGNNFAVRRELFLRIGGCDERLGPGSPGLGGVDMDLFYRLLRAGTYVRYEPRAIVYHERQTHAERLSRRPLYGHGMGAAVAYRWRDGDKRAALLLGQWVALRMSMFAGALTRRDWGAAREEMTMLGSTVRGLVHGSRARPATRRAAGD